MPNEITFSLALFIFGLFNKNNIGGHSRNQIICCLQSPYDKFNQFFDFFLLVR